MQMFQCPCGTHFPESAYDYIVNFTSSGRKEAERMPCTRWTFGDSIIRNDNFSGHIRFCLKRSITFLAVKRSI